MHKPKDAREKGYWKTNTHFYCKSTRTHTNTHTCLTSCRPAPFDFYCEFLHQDAFITCSSRKITLFPPFVHIIFLTPGTGIVTERSALSLAAPSNRLFAAVLKQDDARRWIPEHNCEQATGQHCHFRNIRVEWPWCGSASRGKAT